MLTTNPYAGSLAGREPIASLRDTSRRIADLASKWPDARFEQSHAPGKWTARQILIHLAHVEMVASVRLRFVLAAGDHVIQTFEQDDWMRADGSGTGPDALRAYLAMRAMNLALLDTLTPAQWARTGTHPDVGAISVEWLAQWLAGHERHHLPQLEAPPV